MFKTIKDRWKAESPVFFKQLQKLAYLIGGSSITMLTAINTIPLQVDPIITTVLGYIIVFCIGIAGTSKLTKE